MQNDKQIIFFSNIKKDIHKDIHKDKNNVKNMISRIKMEDFYLKNEINAKKQIIPITSCINFILIYIF